MNQIYTGGRVTASVLRSSLARIEVFAAFVLAACGGGGGGTSLPPQGRSSPALAQLSISVGPTAGGNSVTLTGTNFSPPLLVKFGAIQAPVLTQSTTSVTVTSPPAAVGPVAVTVTNSDGQVSNSLAYTYQAGPLAPSVSTVSPVSGSSLGGLTVSIAGSNFSASPSNPRVKFGDQFAEVLIASETLIVATLPAHSPGVVAVTVTNPDTLAGTLPSAFNYLAAPVLLSVSPDSGSTSGGERIELTGMSFDSTPPPRGDLRWHACHRGEPYPDDHDRPRPRPWRRGRGRYADKRGRASFHARKCLLLQVAGPQCTHGGERQQ